MRRLSSIFHQTFEVQQGEKQKVGRNVNFVLRVIQEKLEYDNVSFSVSVTDQLRDVFLL